VVPGTRSADGETETLPLLRHELSQSPARMFGSYLFKSSPSFIAGSGQPAVAAPALPSCLSVDRGWRVGGSRKKFLPGAALSI